MSEAIRRGIEIKESFSMKVSMSMNLKKR